MNKIQESKAPQKLIISDEQNKKISKMIHDMTENLELSKDVFKVVDCKGEKAIMAPYQTGQEILFAIQETGRALIKEVTDSDHIVYVMFEYYNGYQDLLKENVELKASSVVVEEFERQKAKLAETSQLCGKYELMCRGYDKITEMYRNVITAQNKTIDALKSELQEKIKENEDIARKVGRIQEKVENIETHVKPVFKAVNIVDSTQPKLAEKTTPYGQKNN